jgi:hypothetical protein
MPRGDFLAAFFISAVPARLMESKSDGQDIIVHLDDFHLLIGCPYFQ